MNLQKQSPPTHLSIFFANNPCTISCIYCVLLVFVKWIKKKKSLTKKICEISLYYFMTKIYSTLILSKKDFCVLLLLKNIFLEEFYCQTDLRSKLWVNIFWRNFWVENAITGEVYFLGVFCWDMAGIIDIMNHLGILLAYRLIDIKTKLVMGTVIWNHEAERMSVEIMIYIIVKGSFPQFFQFAINFTFFELFIYV